MFEPLTAHHHIKGLASASPLLFSPGHIETGCSLEHPPRNREVFAHRARRLACILPAPHKSGREQGRVDWLERAEAFGHLLQVPKIERLLHPEPALGCRAQHGRQAQAFRRSHSLQAH